MERDLPTSKAFLQREKGEAQPSLRGLGMPAGSWYNYAPCPAKGAYRR